jgi:hypothetical protein
MRQSKPQQEIIMPRPYQNPPKKLKQRANDLSELSDILKE